MVEAINNMAPTSFLIWSTALSSLTLIALYFSFKNLHFARLIEDTPTSRVRSAHQGYVELIGEAAELQGEPVIAPLSHIRCCWWRYRVERKRDKGWRVVHSGVSANLFLLRDETGECIIDPDEAKVTPSAKTVWYGASDTPGAPPERGTGAWHSETRLFGLNISFNNSLNASFGSEYRYSEETIVPGDPLYAIGLFKSVGETDRQAMQEEQIKERLRQWKADHASLLKRFDRNRDGQIDEDEWTLARRSARTEVKREQMNEPQLAIHTLSDAGSLRRPMLISTREEFEMVSQYRSKSLTLLGGFFLLGSLVVWMFSVRLL
jgi:hypothetical protein